MDCNYYTNNGCCLHLYKAYCEHSSLWTLKRYVRGLRTDLSVLDDYCEVPREIIKEIIDEVLENKI